MNLLRPQWLAPPSTLLLDEAVHIWRSPLTVTPDQLGYLTKLLSPDELARSQRFRFPQHQQRFVVGRATLRLILSQYLQESPARLQFQYSPSGKPELIESGGLEFNLSHSQDLMLCAVVLNCAVGIDLEQLRPVKDLEQLTQRFFASEESRRIRTLPEEARSSSFFQHWTCKEAILKTTGAGLANLTDVELVEVEGALQLARSLGEISYLQSFEPRENFVAAIAVAMPDEYQPQLAFWRGELAEIDSNFLSRV
jgi:4'-phosphopantetheinyl transferase